MTTAAPTLPLTSVEHAPTDSTVDVSSHLQQVEHLRRSLQQAESELTALQAERDGLLAAMRQLTSPVLPIHDDVVVMPLLGDARAQQAQAQALVLRQTTEQARTIDAALRSVARDAEEVAAYARMLYLNGNMLKQGQLWDARAVLFHSTEEQLVNGPDDLLSVFVPNWVDVDEALFDELNIVSPLGPLLASKKERDQLAVCTYIFAEHCRFMCMYPNSDPDPDHPGGFLADEFPPDFGRTGDPVFWTIADEKVNPERVARWTAAYADNAGSGLMVSVIAPIYVRDEPTPRSMIGIDVGLNQIQAIVDAAAKGQHRAAVLVDQSGHLVVTTQRAERLLGLPRADVTIRGAYTDIDLADSKYIPASTVEAMRRGDTGVEQLRVDGTDFVFAYAPVPTVGWSLGVITTLASLRTTHEATFVSELIAGIQRHRARVAVLDATGVVSVDQRTIQQVVEAVQTAKLIGATVLLAGITPTVAQMILELGTDLSKLRSYPDLRTAMRVASAR